MNKCIVYANIKQDTLQFFKSQSDCVSVPDVPGDSLQPGAAGRPHTPGENSSFQQGGSRYGGINVFIPSDGACVLKPHVIIASAGCSKLKLCNVILARSSDFCPTLLNCQLCVNLSIHRWMRMWTDVFPLC